MQNGESPGLPVGENTDTNYGAGSVLVGGRWQKNRGQKYGEPKRGVVAALGSRW